MPSLASDNCKVVDCYTACEDPENPDTLLPSIDVGDHIHPTFWGGRVIARTFFNGLPGARIAVDSVGNELSVPGPLNRSAEVVSGTTLDDAGPDFQAIPEVSGDTPINLGTRAQTDQIVSGPRNMLVYSVTLSAADQAMAEKYCGA